jgi:hypothetical protein
MHAMKGLFVIALWTFVGWNVGGALEQATRLALTVPVLVAFAVAGVYLGVRILRTTTSGHVVARTATDRHEERLAA